jgi:hypothetical protein
LGAEGEAQAAIPASQIEETPENIESPLTPLSSKSSALEAEGSDDEGSLTDGETIEARVEAQINII